MDTGAQPDDFETSLEQIRLQLEGLGIGPEGTGSIPEIATQSECGTGMWKSSRTKGSKIPSLNREDAFVVEKPLARPVTWVTDFAIPVLERKRLLLKSSFLLG